MAPFTPLENTPATAPRLLLWWAITCLTLLAVYALAPQQLGVSLYKLSLVSMAALVGYWIDRALYPYSRPHVHLEAQASDRSALVFCAAMLRRALIVAAAMVSMGLGAQPLPAGPPTASMSMSVPPAAQAHRADLTRAARLSFGLNAPVPLLAAQIHQESDWDPAATSPVGAQGLAQFMPATARGFCARVFADAPADVTADSPGDCNPYNPVWALRAQSAYMADLFAKTPPRYTEYDRFWVALRGYNGGPGHWRMEARATALPSPSREQVDAVCGLARRAPKHCAENLAYPRRILQVLQARYASWGRVVTQTADLTEPHRSGPSWLRLRPSLGLSLGMGSPFGLGAA